MTRVMTYRPPIACQRASRSVPMPFSSGGQPGHQRDEDDEPVRGEQPDGVTRRREQVPGVHAHDRGSALPPQADDGRRARGDNEQHQPGHDQPGGAAVGGERLARRGRPGPRARCRQRPGRVPRSLSSRQGPGGRGRPCWRRRWLRARRVPRPEPLPGHDRLLGGRPPFRRPTAACRRPTAWIPAVRITRGDSHGAPFWSDGDGPGPSARGPRPLRFLGTCADPGRFTVRGVRNRYLRNRRRRNRRLKPARKAQTRGGWGLRCALGRCWYSGHLWLQCRQDSAGCS